MYANGPDYPLSAGVSLLSMLAVKCWTDLKSDSSDI